MNNEQLVVGKGEKWEVRPGVWRYRHSLGKDPATGKYRRSPARTIYTTKKREVDAALEAYKIELNSGVFVKKTADSIGEYAQRFHDNRAGTITPLAYKREGLDVRHIDEIFGRIRLQELRPFMIEDAYAKIRRDGTYTENEIHKIHSKLRQIMEKAVRDDLIAKNPCSDIKVPRPEAKERKSLSAEEAARLLDTLLDSEPDSHITCTLLLLDTGMRRGEALGLTWDNVDLNTGAVFIKQQYAADKDIRSPKSKKSKRHLSISPTLVEYLEDWKAKQAQDLAKYNIKQIKGTPLVHSLTPVMTKKEAKKAKEAQPRVEVNFMDPNDFGRWFRKWCADNGFGKFDNVTEHRDKNGIKRYKRTGYHGLTPHMLRHTQATLLIGANTDIKTVQTRLGHASINMTIDTYSHAIEANDRAASDTFNAILERNRDKESVDSVNES